MKNEKILGAVSATEGAAVSCSVPTDAASHAAPTHTPGPWIVEPHSDTDEVVNVVSEYEKRADGIKVANWIAELDAQIDFDSDVEEQLARVNANAYLIAAAPEMKTACEDALSLLRFIRDREPDAWDRVLKMRSVSGWTALNTWDSLKAALAKAEGRS